MATRLQELKKEFLMLLAEALAPLGFKPRGEDFYRLQPYGKDIINVTFVSHPKLDFEAGLDIGVRHDAVEELVNAHRPDLPKSMVKWTDTIGNRLDNMTRQFTEWKWEISEDADLKQVVRNLMKTAVHSVALPYFGRFSSLEEVLRMLSEDDSTWGSEAHRMGMSVGSPNGGMHAIAVAFLLDKRNEFEELVDRLTRVYKQEVADGSFSYEQMLPSFLALAEDLKRRWTEREY